MVIDSIYVEILILLGYGFFLVRILKGLRYFLNRNNKSIHFEREPEYYPTHKVKKENKSSVETLSLEEMKIRLGMTPDESFRRSPRQIKNVVNLPKSKKESEVINTDDVDYDDLNDLFGKPKK